MERTWSSVSEAIERLKKIKYSARKNPVKLKKGNAVLINGKVYIVEESTLHDDWAEYRVRDPFGHSYYLEVEEDGTFSLWERVEGREKANFLRHIQESGFLEEKGRLDEYEYEIWSIPGGVRLSIEKYDDGTEVYKQLTYGDMFKIL